MNNPNWFEILTETLKIIVGFWMANTARLALHTWKRQSQAQRQIEFLDELSRAVHEFLDLMVTPTELMRYATLGIESYSGSFDLDHIFAHPEANLYIQKNGTNDAKQLHGYLQPCTLVLSKLQALVAKGQIFAFQNYSECQNICACLALQHDRIQAFRHLIGNPSLNWKHPSVQELLTRVLSINPESIGQELQNQKANFIDFLKTNYKAAYK